MAKIPIAAMTANRVKAAIVLYGNDKSKIIPTVTKPPMTTSVSSPHTIASVPTITMVAIAAVSTCVKNLLTAFI